MIELPPSLKQHVASDLTTLAYCWTITRKDGVVFGFTDHDEPIVIDGVIHDPQTGLVGSAVESELGMAISTMEVEGALRSDKISENDLRQGKFNNADVTTTLVNWADQSQRVALRMAKVGKVEFSGGAFKVELQSVAAALDKRQGRIVRRSCDAELGDARCKKNVNTAAYQSTGTVSAKVTDCDCKALGLEGFASNWFEAGTIEWLSGNNAGEKSHITQHENQFGSTSFSIWLPLHNAISVGDSFRVTAGCDKSFQMCKGKFANHLNFRGFPHLPGNDAIYSYVDGTGIFDGGALVP